MVLSVVVRRFGFSDSFWIHCFSGDISPCYRQHINIFLLH